MQNNINYFTHKIFDPSYYQRRFDKDLPSSWDETSGRALLLALPFLSLYKPAGNAISCVMGSARSISSLSETATGFRDPSKSYFYCFGKAGQTGLAVVSLSASLFHFQIGLLVTTGADIGIALVHVVHHLINQEWKLSLEEMTQLLSSCLYLAIMLQGSLELILASLLLQALIQFYQSWSEYQREGRWPEAAAKFAMGTIRLYQARQCIYQIERRNALLSIKKIAALVQRIKRGREVNHLIYSPLHEKGGEVVLSDSNDNSYNFGTYVHGNGKATVKGMNLQFRTHEVDGKQLTQLEFKVNHVFRNRLEKVIQEIKQLNRAELNEVLRLTQSHAKGMKIEQLPFTFSENVQYKMGTVSKISLEGLGSISVGNDTEYPNLYDRVKIELDPGQNLYQMHELLSFLDLDDALRSSSLEDIERLKIGQLFRVFQPKEATLFEREESFFALSIEQLKQEIIKKAPAMEKTFQEYLSKIEPEEILPGRVRYSIRGLSDKVYELGGRTLISAVTGPDDQAFARTASIIKMGMLAPEMRFSNGMAVEGLSPWGDFYAGGGDSVFTQLLTEDNFQRKMRLDDFAYDGDVRILFSLDILETGTYQYHTDSFGWRRPTAEPPYSWFFNPDFYLDRPNIFDFTKEEQRRFHLGQEVMVKECISPSKIQGLIVPNESIKEGLLSYFRDKKITELNSEGLETILNIPIDRFIHVGERLSESWL